MTNIHLSAIHIPLSAHPTVLFHRPVNHNSVKWLLDIISRPKENHTENGGEGCVWGGGGGMRRITHLAQEMGLFEDLHGGVVAS